MWSPLRDAMRKTNSKNITSPRVCSLPAHNALTGVTAPSTRSPCGRSASVRDGPRVPAKGLCLSRPGGPRRVLLRPGPPTRPRAGLPTHPAPFFDHRLFAGSGLTPEIPGLSSGGAANRLLPAPQPSPEGNARVPRRGSSKSPDSGAPQSQPGAPHLISTGPCSAARTPVTCLQTITNSPARPRPGPPFRPAGQVRGAARRRRGQRGCPRAQILASGAQLSCAERRDAVRGVRGSFIALARPPSPRRIPGRAAHPAGAAAGGGSAAVVRFSPDSAPAGLGAPLSGAAAGSGGWAPPRLVAPWGCGTATGWKPLPPAAVSEGSGDGEVEEDGGEAARKSGGSGSWSSSTLRTLRSCRRRQSARSRPPLPASRSSPVAAAGALLALRAPPPPPASGLAARAPGNPDDEARFPAAAAIFSRGLHSLGPCEGGRGRGECRGRADRRALRR